MLILTITIAFSTQNSHLQQKQLKNFPFKIKYFLVICKNLNTLKLCDFLCFP